MEVNSTAINDLISSFYEAALDPTQWETGLRHFAALTNAVGACLLFGDTQEPTANIAFFLGHSPESVKAYNDYYFALDPLVEIAVQSSPGVWMNDWRDTPAERLLKSEFYNDFMRRYDTNAAMASLLLRSGSTVASISVQRPIGQEPFSKGDQALAELVFPHMQRAMRIYQRVHQIGIQSEAANAALDHLFAPIFIVEGSGKVLFANRAADKLCGVGGVISISNGKLCSRTRTLELESALFAAAHARGGRARALRLTAEAETQSLDLVVMPMNAGVQVNQWRRPLALVVAHRHGFSWPSLDQLLHELYGLTSTEARIARLLADGSKPAEVADALCVSVLTVKSHLKAIFLKTGVRRQAELCKLVLPLGSALPEHSVN
ncbi:helix-turn-helix transcriptional regulator [Oxalobacteraceae bacterium OM1]|nr:helix-turn-helix transcriptional regulator [Oxalobacteraceae bacterium OM1]